MSEVKAIEAVDNALSGLAPDERARVLGWAQLKYGDAAKVGAGVAQLQASPQAAPPNVPSMVVKPRPSKRSKTIISMDKNLDLNPPGKQSAAQFGAEKSPTNVKEKCAVAVYYLRDVIEIPKVTGQAVFTYFKHLQWPVPADLKNTLQQAGTEGWLDTADSDDIKLTSMGENLVEHGLLAKAQAKAKAK